jgi:hypothetical protein
MAISSTLSGKQDLNRPIVFSLDKPIFSINPDSIEFYNIRDSVTTKQPFTCLPDPASLRKFIITTKWEENLQYRLLLKPGTVKDIYGN